MTAAGPSALTLRNGLRFNTLMPRRVLCFHPSASRRQEVFSSIRTPEHPVTLELVVMETPSVFLPPLLGGERPVTRSEPGPVGISKPSQLR